MDKSRQSAAPPSILITGSEGLVGWALRRRLQSLGFNVRGLDLRAEDPDERGDVRDWERVRAEVKDADGVIHLAAVSRVIWGEQNPDLCWDTNVGGLMHLLEASTRGSRRPWLVFASSREVYGEPRHLPVTEDAPLAPINCYGRSKVEGERLIAAVQREGMRASVLRLSNVYGSIRDHADRVVTAFARGVVFDEPLRVDGPEHTFDFTHIDDTVGGIEALVRHFIQGGEALPPIHLVTGTPTTLGQLADLAAELAGQQMRIHSAPPRSFDVARFFGCPDRARELLGWSPRVHLAHGLRRLVLDFRAVRAKALDQA